MSKIYTFIEEKDPEKIREFAAACSILGADAIAIFSHPGAVAEDMTWLRDIMGDLWSVTLVTVLPGVAFVRDFVARIPDIDRELLTKGMNGRPPFKSSLLRRVFIPMGSVKLPLSQVSVASERQDLDLMKTFIPTDARPSIFPTSPSPNDDPPPTTPYPVAAPVSRNFVLPETLNEDEKALAEKMLEGRGLRVAANFANIPWQRITKTHLPSIREKFRADGLDFDELWKAAREKAGEGSDTQEGGGNE